MLMMSGMAFGQQEIIVTIGGVPYNVVSTEMLTITNAYHQGRATCVSNLTPSEMRLSDAGFIEEEPGYWARVLNDVRTTVDFDTWNVFHAHLNGGPECPDYFGGVEADAIEAALMTSCGS